MAPSVWNETHLELLIDIEHDAIHSATREKELITALQNNLGTNLKITVRVDNPVAETPAQQKQRQIREKQEAAEKSILTDQGVNKIVDAFGATVAPGSIRPVN
jgi:DNA polymerase-3 subunit gamma/tau